MYQDLTLKALKDLLRDRNIAGRSKATTKEKAIALLEECDRLSADENLPAPVENFTGSPPSPPAPPTFPEPEPEPADESEYTEGVQCPKCAQCGSFETWPERDGGYWCENCNYQFTPPAPPEPEQDNSQPCLSIRQPWAWAIFHMGKDVENRSWQPPRLGRIYIHAGKTYDRAGAAWIEKTFGVRPPGPDDLPMGAIVGHVDVVGCTQNSVSPWAIAGQFHWQLNQPVEISPISCPGELGIFSRHIPLDPKAECFQATLEKAAKLKALMKQTLVPVENNTETQCFNANEKNDDRRERIETSDIQSPSGAVVNKVASTASIAESIPQSFNDVKTTDNDENNSDSAEKLAEQIWRSRLEFIDYHGQPAKRVSLSQAEILVNLSPESVYRLIIFEYGQGIVMSSPSVSAPAASSPASASASSPAASSPASASKFFLSFVSGGRRFWLNDEDNPVPNCSRAAIYSERHAKAKAEYHRRFPQEFPNIRIFERSPNNQWYEHRLVQAGKSWRERSIYEVIPVNPIDLSPRSPPCTA